MKRFHKKELLLVSAPLAFIGLTTWAVQLRQRYLPSEPQIIECLVRPASPLELSQGADVGLTTRVAMPHNYYADLGLNFRVVGGAENADLARRFTQASVWAELSQLTEDRGFRWTNVAPKTQPLEVEISLFEKQRRFETRTKRFEIRADEIPAPDLSAARRKNFRVTKAILRNSATEVWVFFEVQPLIKPDKAWMSQPFSVGLWTLGNGKTSVSVKGEVIGWCMLGFPTYQVPVRMQGLSKWPKDASQFRGMLSINRGWPQEITVSLPRKTSAALIVSTRLAPLPPS